MIRFLKESDWHILIILLVGCAVMLTGLGVPRLWDRDEPRNAGCAREMLERRDWIVPTFNGELRAHKPVLLYWCMMAGYSLFGVSEFTARLPSALCAIGSALATYGIGRRLFSPTAGLWGGIILSTSLMFGVAGRAATPDSLLIFCVTLTMLVYVLSAYPSTDGGYLPKRWWHSALLYGVMGLAVLAKGPVGLVLPTAIIGMFLLIMRWPAAEAPPPASRSWPILLRDLVVTLRDVAPLHFLRTCWVMRPMLAIGVVLFVAAPWYFAVGVKTNGAFLQEFFLTHNLDRATSSMEGHRGGLLWYYPATILVGYFPWSILAIPLVLETVGRLRRTDEHRVGYVFSVCWIGVWVGAFSLAKTKLPSYVTPCYPALALLAGCFVSHLQEGTLLVHRNWLFASLATLVVAGIGLAVGIPLATSSLLPGEGWLGILGVVPVVAGVLAILAWSRRKAAWPAPLMAAAGGVVIVGILGLAAARADRHRQDQEMIVRWLQDSSPAAPTAAYRVLEPSWVFYSHQALPELLGDPAAAARLLESHPGGAIITKAQFAPFIAVAVRGEAEIVCSAPHFLRNERLVIVRQKRAETAKAAQGKKSSR